MRHSNSGKKLGRTPSHRKALFRNMASAMITYGKIRTTEVKAKELRRVVEPQPPEEMMDLPGMRDEMRRPMMLLVAASKGNI